MSNHRDSPEIELQGTRLPFRSTVLTIAQGSAFHPDGSSRGAGRVCRACSSKRDDGEHLSTQICNLEAAVEIVRIAFGSLGAEEFTSREASLHRCRFEVKEIRPFRIGEIAKGIAIVEKISSGDPSEQPLVVTLGETVG